MEDAVVPRCHLYLNDKPNGIVCGLSKRARRLVRRVDVGLSYHWKSIPVHGTHVFAVDYELFNPNGVLLLFVLYIAARRLHNVCRPIAS